MDRDLLEIMKKRRSVRKYTEETVSGEAIEEILQAGMLTPTGHGYRPWQFLVVTDKDKLKELSQCRAAAGMLSGASAAIIVMGDRSVSDTWIEDCSAVMTHMHLMASYLGVGSCWIQVRLRMKDDNVTTEDYVRGMFNIPENLRVEAILSLGMPDGQVKGHEISELDMSKVHFGEFQ